MGVAERNSDCRSIGPHCRAEEVRMGDFLTVWVVWPLRSLAGRAFHLCVGEVPPVGWSSEYRELDLKTIRLVRSLVPKYRGAKYRDARWTGHPGL